MKGFASDVKRRLTRLARLAGVLVACLALAASLEGQSEPTAYDVDEEFAQGIVRGISEGGRVLLVELRDDHELIRGTDPMLSDPAILGDPGSSALRADDRRDGRLRKLDLGRARGWAFIDDLEGGDAEVVRLEEMYRRFRVGQIVEVGALWQAATATITDSVGSRRGSLRPDPRDPRGGGTELQARVDTVRFEGRIQVRVNRAFE